MKHYATIHRKGRKARGLGTASSGMTIDLLTQFNSRDDSERQSLGTVEIVVNDLGEHVLIHRIHGHEILLARVKFDRKK
jgi:hypothetical protein